jgi:hypothetical protein
MDTKHLYNWLFHFNDHTNRWAAFTREDKESYFGNGLPCPSVIYSNTISTLLHIIMKGEGDVKKIKEVLKEIPADE